jgi:hypothetical protein
VVIAEHAISRNLEHLLQRIIEMVCCLVGNELAILLSRLVSQLVQDCHASREYVEAQLQLLPFVDVIQVKVSTFHNLLLKHPVDNSETGLSAEHTWRVSQPIALLILRVIY